MSTYNIPSLSAPTAQSYIYNHHCPHFTGVFAGPGQALITIKPLFLRCRQSDRWASCREQPGLLVLLFYPLVMAGISSYQRTRGGGGAENYNVIVSLA